MTVPKLYISRVNSNKPKNKVLVKICMYILPLGHNKSLLFMPGLLTDIRQPITEYPEEKH